MTGRRARDREDAVLHTGVPNALDVLRGAEPQVCCPDPHAEFAQEQHRRQSSARGRGLQLTRIPGRGRAASASYAFGQLQEGSALLLMLASTHSGSSPRRGGTGQTPIGRPRSKAPRGRMMMRQNPICLNHLGFLAKPGHKIQLELVSSRIAVRTRDCLTVFNRLCCRQQTTGEVICCPIPRRPPRIELTGRATFPHCRVIAHTWPCGLPPEFVPVPLGRPQRIGRTHRLGLFLWTPEKGPGLSRTAR